MATRKYTKRSTGNSAAVNAWADPPAPVARVERSWSPFQQAVFEDVARGVGHTVVMARAGSGKTTTIVEALHHIPAGTSWLLVAFNKSIQVELSARAPAGGEVSTLHSLGLKACTRAFGKVQIDANKNYALIDSVIGEGYEFREMQQTIAKCVSLCKGYLASTVEEIDEVVDKHGIEAGYDAQRSKFIENVQKVLVLAKNKTNVIDFDDMCWQPIVHDLSMLKFDRVLVDETQDLNKGQIELILKSLKPGGRIVAIGDDRQAIYGFRGADQDAIGKLISRLEAKTLPLSITYRCPKSVVALAKSIVSDIEAAPNAEEGTVRNNVSEMEMKKSAVAGDFILSRTNAPLIGLCMAFIKDGKPANIQGRDIGANLTGMIKKSKAKSIKDFLDYVEAYRTRECERLSSKGRDTTAVEDKADCLIALCEGATSLTEVVQAIEKLFSDKDDSNKILLSTTHKAKGMERDTVWALGNTYRPKKGSEEANLWYVCVTRAKKTLHIVR
jgi:DNA helicase-2/ATP-dependent DNA helicase PcrA